MPIKLANNASARLSAPLDPSDTTVVLNSGEVAQFPSLAAGEWHPLTVVAASGAIEIMKVIARISNVLTVERAQEGTTAIAFIVNDRAEVRLTAGAINSMQADILNGAQDMANEAGVDAVAAAEIYTDSELVTVVTSLQTDIANAVTAALPPGFGPVPWSLPTEPAGWIFADGRTLTGATPYTALRAAYIAASFPFGQDGSGNPKVPDTRGRVVAGLDNMGAGAAGRLTGATIGAGLGLETHTLTAAEMPVHAHSVSDPTHAHGVADPTHAHSVYDPGHAHGYERYSTGGIGFATGSATRTNAAATTAAAGTGIAIYAAATGIGIYGAATGISIQNSGSGSAHNNVQPTLVAHSIIKT